MSLGIIILRGLISGSKPNLPDAWEVVYEDNEWTSAYPNGRGEPDNIFHIHLEATSGSLGAFSVFASTRQGERQLKNLADNSNRAWTLRELRNDNSLPAQRIKSMWRSRQSGTNVPVVQYSMAGFDYSNDSERFANLAVLTGTIESEE